MSDGLVLHFCGPCLSGRVDGCVDRVAAALGDGGVDARVAAGPCLGPCARPAALSLQGRGAAYVFAGVRLPEDTGDLVATCRTYLESPGGWIEDARPCGRLRYCLLTRVPGD